MRDVGRADVGADRARVLRARHELADRAAQLVAHLRRRRQVDLGRHLLGQGAVAGLELRERDEERVERRRPGRAGSSAALGVGRAATRTSLRARPRRAPAWWGSAGTPCRRRRRPAGRPPRPAPAGPSRRTPLRPRPAPAPGCGGRRSASAGRPILGGSLENVGNRHVPYSIRSGTIASTSARIPESARP